MKINPGSVALYAGEIAKIVFKVGSARRVWIARDQAGDHLVTVVMPGAGSEEVENLDMTSICWMEIDGPRHPRDTNDAAKRPD